MSWGEVFQGNDSGYLNLVPLTFIEGLLCTRDRSGCSQSHYLAVTGGIAHFRNGLVSQVCRNNSPVGLKQQTGVLSCSEAGQRQPGRAPTLPRPPPPGRLALTPASLWWLPAFAGLWPCHSNLCLVFTRPLLRVCLCQISSRLSLLRTPVPRLRAYSKPGIVSSREP